MQPAHFNTAGAGRMSAPTLAAMTRHLQAERELGPYEAEQAQAQAIAQARQGLARLLNVRSEDIALFDSGTRAWQTVVEALPEPARGARVWVTPYEYAGNLLVLQRLARRHGLHLETVPLDERGDPDLAWMARHLDDSVHLLSVVHVPSACGTVLPVERIGRLVRASGARCFYVVDACQSVGQLVVDVAEIRCDALTAAGRKFLCGPRGTGFAYIGPRVRRLAVDHAVDLHAAHVFSLNEAEIHDASARRFELSECQPAALIGLAHAVAECLEDGIDLQAPLFQVLCERLADCRGLQLIQPGSRQAGIVTFTPLAQAPQQVVQRLHEQALNAWCIAGAHTPLFMLPRGLDAAVRLSVHVHNQPAEVDRLVTALFSICS